MFDELSVFNAQHVKNVPGRKTDVCDARWLADVIAHGMVRASFVPPEPIRELRDLSRYRKTQVDMRAKEIQRLEKVLQDACVKISSVASTVWSKSSRRMIEALIAGERDPRRLADLARGRMKTKRAALIEALTGRFDDHHGELARMLLDQIDALSGQINTLTIRIDQRLATIANEVPGHDDGDSGAGGQPSADLTVVQRLTEIPGIGPTGAQVILAEIGLDMSRFPTAAHLVSWAKLCPRTIQSGAKTRAGTTGKGNPYLKGVLGEAAAAAAKTDTFLGERYRRIVKRRGKLKALVAVARSILIIIWHLLADPAARYHDLGAGYWADRIDKGKKARNHIRQLEALRFTVTLAPAA